MAKKTNTKKTNGAQENGAKTTKPEASETTEDQVKTTDQGDENPDQSGATSTDDQDQNTPAQTGDDDQGQSQSTGQNDPSKTDQNQSNDQDDTEFEWSITFAMNLLEVCRVTSFADLDDDGFAEIEGIWAQAACDQFSPSLALAMFDTALDQGAEIAKLLLQKAVGVKADRDIGAKTQAAIAELAEAEVIELLLAYRLRRAAFAGNAHTDMMPRGSRVLKVKDALHAMKVEGGEDQDGLG